MDLPMYLQFYMSLVYLQLVDPAEPNQSTNSLRTGKWPNRNSGFRWIEPFFGET